MYIPNPIDTSNIILDEEILKLADLLAKNTHEIWSRNRIEEGWTYGAERNEEKKTTPCLVSYEELPENEKKYDIDTSLETLKLIKKLGYKIEKEV